MGQECFILGLGISSFITKGDKICDGNVEVYWKI